MGKSRLCCPCGLFSHWIYASKCRKSPGGSLCGPFRSRRMRTCPPCCTYPRELLYHRPREGYAEHHGAHSGPHREHKRSLPWSASDRHANQIFCGSNRMSAKLVENGGNLMKAYPPRQKPMSQMVGHRRRLWELGGWGALVPATAPRRCIRGGP